MADYDVMSASGSDAEPSREDQGFYSIGTLKKQYFDYLGAKSSEIDEQKQSRRYYHGAQWTDKEIKALKKRKQPIITTNRIVRKVDAVIGLVERLKQDPKAYPRTPNQEAGAEIATAVLRYALDHVDWNSKAPRAARMGAIDGIGGIELDLAYGDHGDPDIDLHLVYPDTFFYDPRSYDDGFTDARFMGISKWIDIDQAKELVPEAADQIDAFAERGADMTTNSDREVVWYSTTSKKIRMVDHWYICMGKWCWCLYAGAGKLMEGFSPYVDERGKSFSKFVMFSAAVDHDGDRYGFVRNFKGSQDEINHRRSKALHILNSRRIIADKGAVDDVEKARFEWARPDGFLEVNPGKKAQPEDQTSDFAGQLKMLEDAKAEIENFGPNPALIGTGLDSSSGVAIKLLQQAGIAELGPYIIAYKTFKIRVYRAIWSILQRYWTAERWIRVTDDEGLAQFIQLNGLTQDQYGQPAISNYLGSLDVDIVIDEGPDNVTMMADSFDTMMALARGGTQIPPNVLIELSPLQNSVKQKLLKQLDAAANDPQRQQAKDVAIQGESAKVGKTKADTIKSIAEATRAFQQAQDEAAKNALAGFNLPGINDTGPLAGPPQQSGPGPAQPPLPLPSGGPGPVPGAIPVGQGPPSGPIPPITPGVMPPGSGQF